MDFTKFFTKKEKSEIDTKFSKLKKIIHKKDEISVQESIDILKDLSQNNQQFIATKISVLSQKQNKFMDNLTMKLIRLDDSFFTIDVMKEVIDYCFRYGNANIQKNGVILLSKYKGNTELLERYRFVFLKDKKALAFLKTKIYAVEDSTTKVEEE